MTDVCDVSHPLGISERLADNIGPISSSQVISIGGDLGAGRMLTSVAVQIEGFSLMVVAYTDTNVHSLGIVSSITKLSLVICLHALLLV